MRQRRGDSAEMAYIELVDREGELRKASPVTAASAKSHLSAPIHPYSMFGYCNPFRHSSKVSKKE